MPVLAKESGVNLPSSLGDKSSVVGGRSAELPIDEGLNGVTGRQRAGSRGWRTDVQKRFRDKAMTGAREGKGKRGD